MQLSSLHLQQSSCTPDVIKGSRVMFKVPLYDCGTKLSSGAHFLSYSNVVANSASNQTVQKGISFDPEFYYPFSCRYTRDYSLHLISQQNVYKNETRKTGWWFFWFSFVIITVVKVILAVMKQLKLQCDSNPWPPRYRCSALPTEPWSLVGISTGFLCNCFSCFTTASITFTSILHPQWRRCISHTHLSNDFPHPTPPETTYHDTHLCYYSCHYTLLLLDLSWVELSIHVSSTSASFFTLQAFQVRVVRVVGAVLRITGSQSPAVSVSLCSARVLCINSCAAAFYHWPLVTENRGQTQTDLN